MEIPPYTSFLDPMLVHIQDGAAYQFGSVYHHLVRMHDYGGSVLSARLPSGRTVIDDRIQWAKRQLRSMNHIIYPKPGYIQITPQGKRHISCRTEGVRDEILPVEQVIHVNYAFSQPTEEMANPLQDTPEGRIAHGSSQLRSALALELLDIVKGCSPLFFEQLVIKLLLAMGYGGTLEDAGTSLGKTGDGGVDGVIKADRLGLDVVYIQAKRWKRTAVGSPHVQAFVGSLQGYKAQKGVFITTSKFSKQAWDYVKKAHIRVVLIDGAELANLMIDYNIGVSTQSVYKIKKVDIDYFESGGQ